MGAQVAELLGYSADELLAEPGHFERLVHPDDRDRVMTRARRADRTGEPWVDEYRVVHRDGSTRWFHGSARRVTPDGVSPALWQGVTMDITSSRRDEPEPRHRAGGGARLGRRHR
jgi:PAS domain S-box-containing protein